MNEKTIAKLIKTKKKVLQSKKKVLQSAKKAGWKTSPDSDSDSDSSVSFNSPTYLSGDQFSPLVGCMKRLVMGMPDLVAAFAAVPVTTEPETPTPTPDLAAAAAAAAIADVVAVVPKTTEPTRVVGSESTAQFTPVVRFSKFMIV